MAAASNIRRLAMAGLRRARYSSSASSIEFRMDLLQNEYKGEIREVYSDTCSTRN